MDIAGYDEKRYRVINDAMGRQLHAHVRQQVVAQGRVIMLENRLSIYVSRFQIEAFDAQLSGVMGAKES